MSIWRPMPARALSTPFHGHGLWLILAHVVMLPLSAMAIASPLEISVTAEVSAEVDVAECSNEPAGSPQIHDVMLNFSGDQRFIPSFVQAGIGEVIRFTRLSENIMVDRSTFSDACTPAEPVETLFGKEDVAGGRNQTLLVIQSLEPYYFTYRLDAKSVQCSSGTVFAINPGSTWETFAAQADAQRRGNLTRPTPDFNLSREGPAWEQHSRTSTASPLPPSGRGIPTGSVWYPWTTMVATVTSMMAS